jgi:hypothetical protein
MKNSTYNTLRHKQQLYSTDGFLAFGLIPTTAKEIKYNTSFGKITRLQEKVDTTCKSNAT